MPNVTSNGEEPIAPDFYVVGLQEMVPLDVVGAVTCPKDKERMMQWETLVN